MNFKTQQEKVMGKITERGFCSLWQIQTDTNSMEDGKKPTERRHIEIQRI